jgi:LysM repeat protein
MIHTVKSGETLSGIAGIHGITLAKLLDANPALKANPNVVQVGAKLNIPELQISPVQPPAPAPAPQPAAPPKPQPAAGHVLGKLSERFETGGKGPGVVSTGAGDAGGRSYGSYQMTSKPGGGRVKQFVSQTDFRFRDRFVGLVPGTDAFTAAWKTLARERPDEFHAEQHEFIKRTHFDPLAKKIRTESGLDVPTRSHALQDVIWSTAVQHGPGSGIPVRAIGTLTVQPGDPAFDRQLIKAIYAERGRRKPDGTLAHFSRNSLEVQRGVARRFVDEERLALEMLANG